MPDDMGLGMTHDINKSIASSSASASSHGSEDRASTCPGDEFRDDSLSHPKDPTSIGVNSMTFEVTPKRARKPTDSVVPITQEKLDSYVQACLQKEKEKWIKENPSPTPTSSPMVINNDNYGYAALHIA